MIRLYLHVHIRQICLTESGVPQTDQFRQSVKKSVGRSNVDQSLAVHGFLAYQWHIFRVSNVDQEAL